MTGVWSVFIGKATTVDSSGGTFSDFNGDGRSDVAVLADNGVVLVYYGAAEGFESQPTALFVPDPVRFASGGDLAAVGDISGDGLGDLVIAAPTTASDSNLALYVFLGRASGLDPQPSQTISVDTNMQPGTPTVRGGMDINSDGYGDLLVLSSDGAAIPMFGGRGDLLQGNAISIVGLGLKPTNALVVCDLDGDGIGDFATIVVPTSGGPIPAIFRGTGTTFAPDNISIPSHGEADEGFSTMSCADTEGDGYPELLLGAPFSNARGMAQGDLLVFDNLNGTLSTVGRSVAGQVELAQTYSSTRLGLLGDMNGDGIDEVAIGLGGEADAVQVAFKALSLVASDTIEVAATPDVEGSFGSSLTGGDFDGDGLADLLVGSPSHANGRVTLFRGSRTARILAPSAIHLDAPAGVSGFGQRLSTSR